MRALAGIATAGFSVTTDDMKKIAALLLLALPVPALAQGMVSAADPRAAAAGAEILKKGGSATDAAIATMLALNVVEPQGSGIGGGAFFVQYDAKKKKITTIDGREKAPAAANPRWFYRDGKLLTTRQAIPGGRSVGVPGTIRAMQKAHAQSGKLPWADLFAPAIRLANEGFEVTPRLANAIRNFGPHLDAGASAIFRDQDGNPLPAGTKLRNPAQGALFTQLASEGADSFYVGPVAQKIVDAANNSERSQSQMTIADLAAYEAKDRPTVCSTYRKHKICSMGPPSSGGISVLLILKQLERFDMTALGKDSPIAWSLFSDSSRLAFADRDMYMADPDFVTVPVKGLLDKRYIASRSALLDPNKALTDIKPGKPRGAPERLRVTPGEIGGTTSLSVSDSAGNIAQVTTTIESSWGSGVSFEGTMLNNELTDFDIAPEADGHLVANRVEGGKRPRSSMSPTIVYGPDGKVRMALGAAGGPTIISQIAKAIVGVLDWNLSAQEALGLGLIFAPGPVATVERGTTLEALVPALEKLGQNVRVAPLGLKANAIEYVDGKWVGAADPRSEGASVDENGVVTMPTRAVAITRPSE